jgi:hypothetical protein
MSGGFSAQWLSLREPYDVAARNGAVLSAAADAFAGRTAIAVVDLACGTGATLRAITGRLPPRQHWRLVDNDLGLLTRAAALGRPPDTNVLTRPIDLVRDLELALEPPLDLITASALLDLVSSEWLDRFAIEAAARRLPVYVALTFDGRISLEPSEAFDHDLVAAFKAHQRSDKGFGPALGPTAGERAADRFAHFGYAVVKGRSDWMLEPKDAKIQDAVFCAWAELNTLTLPPDVIAKWLALRRAHLAAGRSRLEIGHVDIFARPMGRR